MKLEHFVDAVLLRIRKAKQTLKYLFGITFTIVRQKCK
jgi:hypothetical protein